MFQQGKKLTIWKKQAVLSRCVLPAVAVSTGVNPILRQFFGATPRG